jgi:hypothetical protein
LNIAGLFPSDKGDGLSPRHMKSVTFSKRRQISR